MAQEIQQPEKHIPKAMGVGLLIIFAINLLYGLTCIKYVPLGKLAESMNPHILVAQAVLGKPGLVIISIVSLFATASTVNTVIAVVPRMLYSMALNGELPAVFGKLHPRFRTPWIGILAMSGGIGCFYFGGIANAGNIMVYLLAAVSSWLLCYIVAHIDVIVLRLRYPQLKRPYKSPFFPFPQILGALGMLASFINIFPDPEIRNTIMRWSGLFIGMSVVYSALWLKFVLNQKLFKPAPLEPILKYMEMEEPVQSKKEVGVVFGS
jgi:amino acid transporter